MRKWTYEELIAEGYKVENGKITDVELSMRDHGCMTLFIAVEGCGIGFNYGGYCIGKGYLGADDKYFSGSASGMESIIRIMDIVGVDNFTKLKGRYLRFARNGFSKPVKIIGNIINDRWFDIETFFDDKRSDDT